jgi:WD40 repeat protein
LFALEGTSLPDTLQVINVSNAAQVSALAEWRLESVTDLSWTPDSSVLAVSNPDTIDLYEVLTRKKIRTLYPRGGGVVSIAFSPNGEWLAAGSRYGSEWDSYAGDIQLWLGTYLQPLGILYAETRAVSEVAFSPDSKTLAVAYTSTKSDENRVEFRDTATWEVTRTLTTGAVLQIAFSPAGGLLASVPDRYATKLWNLKDGKLLDTIYTSFTGAVSSLEFSGDGRYLATGHYDGAIRLWDLNSGELAREFQSNGVIESLAFSPDSTLLASGESFQDSDVRLWAVDNGDLLRTLNGHVHAVDKLAFSPHGQVLVSASYDGDVLMWGIRP